MFQKRSLGQSSSCTTFWMFLFFFMLAWYMKSGIHWLRARIFSPRPLKKEHGIQRAAGLVRKWTRGSVLEVAIFFESGGMHDAGWVRRSLNLSLAFAWSSSLEHISTPFFLLQISLSLAYRATHKSSENWWQPEVKPSVSSMLGVSKGKTLCRHLLPFKFWRV